MKIKNLSLLATVCLMFCMACKKPEVRICCTANLPDHSIFHQWNIVSDSTYTGVGITNHQVGYLGQPGDYFNMTINGIVYTKEGAKLDTLTYQLVTDSTIVISSFGITLNGVPATSHFSFTPNTMSISTPVIATPGGLFGRKITLSR